MYKVVCEMKDQNSSSIVGRWVRLCENVLLGLDRRLEGREDEAVHVQRRLRAGSQSGVR
jgi:hypothetical protein